MNAKWKIFPVVTALCASVTGGAVVANTTGCNSAWWQNVKANPLAAVMQFVQYVLTFLPAVQTLWQTIAPTVSPAAQATFNLALLKCNQSLAALQDGLKVAEDTQVTDPDLGALLADVQAACAALWQVVTVNSPPADAGVAGAVYGASSGDLSAQAAKIWAWRKL